MRTVHETESLRPSDPVPKHHSAALANLTPSGKPIRVKLNPPKQSPLATNGTHAESDSEASLSDEYTYPIQWPEELWNDLTESEQAMKPSQLYRLLRRQLHWAETYAAAKKEEMETAERERRTEFERKELLLANVLEADLALMKKDADEQHLDVAAWVDLLRKDLPEEPLPVGEGWPWERLRGQARVAKPEVEGLGVRDADAMIA